MGLFEDMSKALNPHAEKLNNTIHLQGALLHTRLGGIEKALSDMARPDIGDLWADLGMNGVLAAKTPKEIGVVQLNEVLMVQAFAAIGAAAVKRVILRANGRLRASLPVLEASPGLVTPGGDIVFLAGEIITIEAEAEGQVEVTVTCVRRGLQVRPVAANTGVSGERDASMNTHDPARDIIASRTGGYSELPPEVRDTGGSPPLIHPGRS
jgi:hypothetical protein